MDRALSLAMQGGRLVHPNPYVGCVIARGGRVLGEGWHARSGGPHAEVMALREAGTAAKGATLYVTLEPCAHYGRTPPCVKAIIAAGIARLEVAIEDANPQVAGKGIAALAQAGIEVKVGLRQKEAAWLNRRFFTFMQKNRPYIILKWAESIEGHMRPKQRRACGRLTHSTTDLITHMWRAREDAIAVGRRTAALDNPRLTVRHSFGAHPVRVALDPEGRLPNDLRLFTESQAPTLVYARAGLQVAPALPHVEYRQLKSKDFLQGMLKDMHARGLISVLVEGGERTLSHLIAEGLWDEARVLRTARSLPAGLPAPALLRARARMRMPLSVDELQVYTRRE